MYTEGRVTKVNHISRGVCAIPDSWLNCFAYSCKIPIVVFMSSIISFWVGVFVEPLLPLLDPLFLLVLLLVGASIMWRPGPFFGALFFPFLSVWSSRSSSLILHWLSFVCSVDFDCSAFLQFRFRWVDDFLVKLLGFLKGLFCSRIIFVWRFLLLVCLLSRACSFCLRC